jgi:2-keto-3-deoxy-6-phosphogluconate aldolase
MDYLNEKSVLAAGGTWLAKKDDIAQGRWDKIADNCRKVCELVGR